jgi:hypothetical protein
MQSGRAVLSIRQQLVSFECMFEFRLNLIELYWFEEVLEDSYTITIDPFHTIFDVRFHRTAPDL